MQSPQIEVSAPPDVDCLPKRKEFVCERQAMLRIVHLGENFISGNLDLKKCIKKQSSLSHFRLKVEKRSTPWPERNHTGPGISRKLLILLPLSNFGRTATTGRGVDLPPVTNTSIAYRTARCRRADGML